MRRILWHNVRPRFWLWRHQCHSKVLTGDKWVCDCRSTMTRP